MGGKTDELSAAEITGLRWAKRCNEDFGCGFLGPTVKRQGPIAAYEQLVRNGYLRCEEDWGVAGRRYAERCGYYITPEGLSALKDGKETP